MTQEHPITLPPELVREWAKTCSSYEVPADHIATQAARWGADQELEACCEWLNCELGTGWGHGTKLRAARRPKPPILKKQALKALEDMLRGYSTEAAAETIRCFIKSLPDES